MRNIRIRTLIGAAATAVLAAIMVSCGGGGGDSTPAPTPAPTPTPTPTIIRTAVLSGGTEVPPVATSATGSGAVIVTRATRAITGGVHFAGLTPTVAHIHIGAPTVAGDIIITLVVSPDGTATVPPGSVLSEAQFAAFEAGNLYFNVHTNANPNGEIRGHLITAPATIRAGTATLTGAQQVPPVTTAATGQGTLVFDSSNGLIYTSYITHNVGATTTAAHIHQGTATQNGNIQVNFTHGATLATAPAGSTLTAQDRMDFGNGALYFNVHSVANAGGEIRGQISVLQ